MTAGSQIHTVLARRRPARAEPEVGAAPPCGRARRSAIVFARARLPIAVRRPDRVNRSSARWRSAVFAQAQATCARRRGDRPGALPGVAPDWGAGWIDDRWSARSGRPGGGRGCLTVAVAVRFALPYF